MNPWQRWLTLVLIAYLAAASVYAMVELVRGMEPMLSWLGLAIAALAPLSHLGSAWYRGNRDTARPPLLISILSGLGVAVTMALSWRHGPAAGNVHVWAGLAFIGWAAWIRWLADGQ